MRIVVFLVLLLRVASADPMNAIIGDRGVPADATDEVERIRGHLSHVLRELRAVSPTVRPEQLARRSAALDALERYIVRGQFPKRTDDAYGERRPRFIDDRGVHCAVAELIAASGGEETARAINDTHEYDYVLDMHEPALEAWASTNGFTLVELAMIQPTYHELPADHMAKELLARNADELVLRCAATHQPVGYAAFQVKGAANKNLVVTTKDEEPFARCMAIEASKLATPRGDYGDDNFEIGVELSLRTPQQILDRRLKLVDIRGCMPRPGDLPDSVTISVERGTLSILTTPINGDVAMCIFERVEDQLRVATFVRGVRGDVTRKIERYTPQMFNYAFMRAKDRVIHDCQKAHGDGESMHIAAGAKLDGDVWIEVPGTTKVAACMREKLPVAIREHLSLPLASGQKYFRIDADIPKRQQYVKCGNGVCY